MKYTIEAAHTMEQVIDRQCDLVESADTLKEACARARYLLTDEFRRSCEMSEPFHYAQVCKANGEVVKDFFRAIDRI